MADVKVGIRFQKSFNGADKSETFRIVSADVSTNRVIVEVEKEFNGELWTTKRNLRWQDVQTDFHNNQYEYCR